MKLDLQNTARYYYYPGWHEPATVLEFVFNKKAYEALPVDVRRILDFAVTASQVHGLVEYEAKNIIALHKLKTDFKGKVDVIPLPAVVLRDLRKLATDVIREESDKSPMARRVYASFTKFQRELSSWRQISENAYHQCRAMTSRRLAQAAPILVALLAVVALETGAQPARRVHRIGVLNEAWAANHPTVEGLQAGLRELGLKEGRDVKFDIRFTEGNLDAMPAAAMALAKAGVDLIVTSQYAAARAAKDATTRVPIVFTLLSDPVATGIVANPASPEGNVTGVTSLQAELVGKRLEILKILLPSVRRVWVIHHTADPSAPPVVAQALSAGLVLKLDVIPRGVLTPEDLALALRNVRPGDALLAPETSNLDIPTAILQTSLAARVPAVFTTALWVGHGGLVSYGPDYYAHGFQAASLVAKLLRGARPSDVPVEGTDKIDLSVNLKTADLLGITVPRKILLRADAFRR
jgi:putative ABC transport system substrate-binding protein